jgi:hypothetical protein
MDLLIAPVLGARLSYQAVQFSGSISFSTKLDLAKHLAKWISEIDDADDGNDN